MILRTCEPLKDQPIGSIQAMEIQALLEVIRDGDDDHEPRRALANGLYDRLAKFFRWRHNPAIRKVTSNPMLGIKRPAPGQTGTARPWYKGKPGDEAIVALWHVAAKLDPVTVAMASNMPRVGQTQNPARRDAMGTDR
jgi:hypothetical protein